MNLINVFQPTLGDDELYAVSEVFKSGWLGAGKKVEEFTERFASKIGTSPERLITLSSCTDGLFLAMQLMEFGVGLHNEVIMPSIHFVGAANAVMAANGYPIFCDVDPVTLNPTLDHIRKCVDKKYTRAVCILHYGGRPCDEIVDIAEYCFSHRLTLIEDSACSLDSYLNGKACGTFGDIGLWSFDPMKLLTAGDGGMMYISDKKMMERAKKLNFFGLSKKSGLSASQTQESRWWEFDVDESGRYSTMTDIDAAIMLKQLDSLPDFKKQRAIVDSIYRRCLSDIDGLTLCPLIQPGGVHSYYFFWIQTKKRDKLAKYLKDNNIYTTFRYYPLHNVQHYGTWEESGFPGSNLAAQTTLLLPIHAALSIDDVTYICGKVREFFLSK